jgi:hypothetical protein
VSQKRGVAKMTEKNDPRLFLRLLPQLPWNMHMTIPLEARMDKTNPQAVGCAEPLWAVLLRHRATITGGQMTSVAITFGKAPGLSSSTLGNTSGSDFEKSWSAEPIWRISWALRVLQLNCSELQLSKFWLCQKYCSDRSDEQLPHLHQHLASGFFKHWLMWTLQLEIQ